MNGAVQGIIKGYLKDYLCVDERSLDKLVVSLWQGHMEVFDLELESFAFNKLLGLPVSTKRSKVHKLTVKVPWSHIQSQPVEIFLSGVEIIAVPDSNQDYERNENDDQEKKMRKLEQLNNLYDSNDDDIKDGSFWEKLGTKILNNLQLVFNDISIVLEDDSRFSSITIDRISMLSTDDKWNESFSLDSSLSFKLAKIDNFQVHVRNGPDRSPMTGKDLLFNQENLQCKMVLNKKGGTTQSVDISVELGGTTFSISHSQFLALSGASEALGNKNSPRARWKRAIAFTFKKLRLGHLRDKQLSWVVIHRDRYISLFKRTLQVSAKPALTEKESLELDGLERNVNFTLPDIIKYRKVAYQEERIRLDDPLADVKKRRDTKIELKTDQRSGWFSSWWGTKQQEPSVTVPEDISKEAREKLYETIGYDPKSDKVIGFQTAEFKFKFAVKLISINLTELGIQLYSLELNALQAAFTFQNYVKYVGCSAETLYLHDKNEDTDYPLLIYPSQDTSNKLFDFSFVGQQDGANAVSIALEQPVNAIYSHHLITTIVNIIDTPSPAEPSDTWQVYSAAYSESNVEDVINSSPSISISIVAPTLYIPKQHEKSSVLVVHLGSLVLKQFGPLQWDINVQKVSMLLERLQLEPVHLLQDILINASVNLSGDKSDLTQPRIQIDLNLPSLQVFVPLDIIKELSAIVSGMSSTPVRVISGVQDYPLPLAQTTAVVTASRKLFHVTAIMDNAQLVMASKSLNVVLGLESLKSTFESRSFDSIVTIEAAAIQLTDTFTQTDILKREGNSSIFRCEISSFATNSPIFDKYSSVVEMTCGRIGVHLSQILLENIVSTLEVHTTFPKPKIEDDQDAQPSYKEYRVVLETQSLGLKLTDIEDQEFCNLLLSEARLRVTPDGVDVSVLSLQAVGAENSKIIDFVSDSSGDVLDMEWSPTAGYLVDVLPFQITLRPEFMKGIDSMVRIVSKPSNTLLVDDAHGSDASMSSPKIADEASKFELRLKEKKPLVLQIVATDDVELVLQLDSFSLHDELRLGSVTLMLNNTHTLLQVDNMSYDFASNKLLIENLKVAMSANNLNLLKSVDIASIASGYLNFHSNDSLGADAPPSNLQIGIATASIRMLDTENSNDVKLQIDDIVYGDAAVTLGSLVLSEDDEALKYLWHSPIENQPFIVVSLEETAKCVLNGECFVVVHGKSVSALSTLISFLLSALSFIPSSPAISDAEIFNLLIPSVEFTIKTFRPEIEDLVLVAKDFKLRVPSAKDRVLISLPSATWGTSFVNSFIVQVVLEPSIYQVNILVGDTFSLRLTPLSSYIIFAAMKNNLLRLGEGPVYKIADQSGSSTKFNFQSSLTDIYFLTGAKAADIHVYCKDLEMIAENASFSLRFRLLTGSCVTSSIHQVKLDEMMVEVNRSEQDEMLIRNVDVKVMNMMAIYNQSFVQSTLDYGADVELIRISNLLQYENEQEESDSSSYEFDVWTRTTFVASPVCILFPDDQLHGIAFQGEISGTADVQFSGAQLLNDTKLTLEDSDMLFCILDQQFNIQDQFSLVAKTSLHLSTRTESSVEGLLEFREINVHTAPIVMEGLMPILPKVAHVVLTTLRNRPTTQDIVVSKADVVRRGSEYQYEGARYKIAVAIDSLLVLFRRRNCPVVQYAITKPSLFVGQSMDKALRLHEAVIRGSVDVSGISVSCFNDKSNAWESILEPLDTEMSLQTIPQESHMGMELTFNSPSPVRLNVYHRHVETVYRAIEEGHSMWLEMNDDASATWDKVLAEYEYDLVKYSFENRSNLDQIQVNGISVSYGQRVSVDLQHRRCFLATEDKTLDEEIGVAAVHAKVLPGTSLCAHVVLDSKLNFLVMLCSLFSVVNHCDIPLYICAMDEQDDSMEFDLVDPGASYFVSAKYISESCFIKIREREEDLWQNIKILHPEKICCTDTQRCFNVEPVRTIDSRYELHVRPVIQVANSLPVSIWFRVKEGDAAVQLESGGTIALYALQKFVRFGMYEDRDWGISVPSESAVSRTIKYIFKGASQSNHAVDLVYNDGSLSLHAQFWLVDATNLNLSFCRGDFSRPLMPESLRSNQVTDDTWEHQRWYLGDDWSSEMLPGDSPLWSDLSGKHFRPKLSIELPDDTWHWLSEWEIDSSHPNTDSEGWQYASGFFNSDSNINWTAEKGWNDFVRRRRWTRKRVSSNSSVMVWGSHRVTFFGYTELRVAVQEKIWSEPVDLLVAVGTETLFKVHCSDVEFYELVLSVEQHDSFPGTKLCTLSPRLVVMNNLSLARSLRCMQAHSHQNPLVVPPYSAKPFAWTSASNKLQVQIESEGWSEAIALDDLTDFCVLIAEQQIYVEVLRTCIAGTMLVKFSDNDASNPFYKLQNISQEKIFCCQLVDFIANGKDAHCFEISPFSFGSFAWRFPSKPHVLRMFFNCDSTEDMLHSPFLTDMDLSVIGEPLETFLPRMHFSCDPNPDTLGLGEPFFMRWGPSNQFVGASARTSVDRSLLVSIKDYIYEDWNVDITKDIHCALYFDPLEGTSDEIARFGNTYAISTVSLDGKTRRLTADIETMSLLWRVVSISHPSIGFEIGGGTNGAPVSDQSMTLSFQGYHVLLNSATLSKELKPSLVTVERALQDRDLPSRSVCTEVDIADGSRVIRVSLERAPVISLKNERQRLMLTVTMQDVGVSLITEDGMAPRELMFISTDLNLKLNDTNLHRDLDVSMNSLRFDNCLKTCAFPNLLRRYPITVSPKPLINLSVRQRHSKLNVMILEHLELKCSDIDLHIDEETIEALVLFKSLLVKSLRYQRLPFDFLAFEDLINVNHLQGERNYFFLKVALDPIRIYLSFFKSDLIGLSDAPVDFPLYQLTHGVGTSTKIVQELALVYSSLAKSQMLRLMGYALPGNPAEILGTLGGDLASGNILAGILKGTVKSGFGMIGSVGTAVSSINRTQSGRISKPRTFGEGMDRAGEAFSKGFADGFNDLMTMPQKADNGVLGAFAGIGKGLFGAVSKPVAGLGGAISSMSKGIVAETKSKAELEADEDVFQRKRPVRVFDQRDAGYILADFDLTQMVLVAQVCGKLGLTIDLYRSAYVLAGVKIGIINVDDRTVLVKYWYETPANNTMAVSVEWQERFISVSTEPLSKVVALWQDRSHTRSISAAIDKINKHVSEMPLPDLSSMNPEDVAEYKRLISTITVRRSPRVNMQSIAFVISKLKDQMGDTSLLSRLLQISGSLQGPDLVLSLVVCRAFWMHLHMHKAKYALELFESAIFELI